VEVTGKLQIWLGTPSFAVLVGANIEWIWLPSGNVDEGDHAIRANARDVACAMPSRAFHIVLIADLGMMQVPCIQLFPTSATRASATRRTPHLDIQAYSTCIAHEFDRGPSNVGDDQFDSRSFAMQSVV